MESNPDQLTFSLEAPPVKVFRSQDFAADLMTIEEISALNLLSWLVEHGPDGLCGRTSPASCQVRKDGILGPSSGAWGNSGMGGATGFSMRNISEFHSAAGVSSLSDILETGDLPRRYFLSAKACKGILRRAEKRGKALPTQLRRALQSIAEQAAGRTPCPAT